jgi:hypothetical protein
MLGNAAHAQCTPEGMARYRAADARLAAAAARIKAGKCDAIPEWKQALAAVHAILRRSQSQTVPYTCNVNIKYPATPRCGGNTAAKGTEPTKRAARSPPDSDLPKSNPSRSSSCSDITGTSSNAPAATHCKNADRSLYAARQMRKSNPQSAATEYKKAATAARTAGDTNLELSILREAADTAAVAITTPQVADTAPTSNPTSASASAQPTASGMHAIWDGTFEKCPTASPLEQSTAAWYYECVLRNKPVPEKSLHKPNPDPYELGRQAREACGSYSRDTQQCYADFKLKVILAKNPGMREACEKTASERNALRQQLARKLGSGDGTQQKFLECVDNAYLYGDMGGPSDIPKTSLRESLRDAMNKKAKPTASGDGIVASDGQPNEHACWAQGRCCPPGQGMKQTPGAFGARSCQPLGGFLPNTKRLDLDAKDAADSIEEFEQRVKSVATNAVAAAATDFSGTISDDDRNVCMEASLAAAWSVLKGGMADVPEKCRAMANAAIGYLPRYADTHVDNSSDLMEDILANFRSDALPDARTQHVVDCVRRGGNIEGCSSAFDPPAAQPSPRKPLSCFTGEEEKNGVCVAKPKSCNAGYALNSDGDCVRVKAKSAAPPRRATRAPLDNSSGSESSRGTLDCSTPAGLLACANRELSKLQGQR